MKNTFSLNRSDVNNLKGQISETVFKDYYKKVLFPSLKKDWNYILFRKYYTFGDIIRFSNRMFIAELLYPSEKLKEKMIKIGEILKNDPDGILFLLNDTQKRIILRNALEESNLLGFLRGFWPGEPDLYGKKYDLEQELPIVDGEIHIIEVKSDKAKLQKFQIEQYKELVRAGYPVRYYHIDIISFLNNKYEIYEKIITEETEIKYKIID